jgi:hypothetical protein
VQSERINLAEGETKEFNFTANIDLVIGEYDLYVLFDPNNIPQEDETLIFLGDPVSTNILNVPTESPNLVLNSAISFGNNAKVDKTNATLTASITNLTGFYESKLIVFIFNSSSNSSVTYIGYQDAFIDNNETLNYSINSEINLDPGDYKAIIYCMNTNEEWQKIGPNNFGEINFTLIEGPTCIKLQNDSKLLSIFPNPAKNEFLFKTNEKIKSYTIYNLTSELILSKQTDFKNEEKVNVEALKAGVYILKVDTENGSIVSKFVKQ